MLFLKGVNFMKKVFCIILSMLMLLSLFGCTGNTDPEDIRGEVSGTTEGNQEEKPEFSLGDTTGSTYTNDFLGISCTLPEGWVFYTDEQIKEQNNITENYLDEEVIEQLKKAPPYLRYDRQEYDRRQQHQCDHGKAQCGPDRGSEYQGYSGS